MSSRSIIVACLAVVVAFGAYGACRRHEGQSRLQPASDGHDSRPPAARFSGSVSPTVEFRHLDAFDGDEFLEIAGEAWTPSQIVARVDLTDSSFAKLVINGWEPKMGSSTYWLRVRWPLASAPVPVGSVQAAIATSSCVGLDIEPIPTSGRLVLFGDPALSVVEHIGVEFELTGRIGGSDEVLMRGRISPDRTCFVTR